MEDFKNLDKTGKEQMEVQVEAPIKKSTPPIILKKPKDKGNRGTTLALDIVKKYSKIPFNHSLLNARHVTEKSGIVKRQIRGHFKRVILLTTCFGKVTVTIPKGQTVRSFFSIRNTIDYFNARHIVLLTKEKSFWTFWWRTTSGEIVSFRSGQNLSEYLERLALLGTESELEN